MQLITKAKKDNTNYIDTMINILDQEANIYADAAGYYYEIEGTYSRRNFNSYDEVTDFLYKNGFIW